MLKFLTCLPLFFLLLLQTSCVSSPARLAAADQRIEGAQKRAADQALKSAGDSLVVFKVENPRSNNRDRNRIVTFSGVVLTEEGHLLAPYNIAPDSEQRIEAWIRDQRYLARPVKNDDSLGMTIVKVEPSQPLVPLDIAQDHMLEPGQNAYTVIASDASSEFKRFVFQAFCQGIFEGRYRQYSLSPLPSNARGGPLFDSKGQLVGITNQSNAWVLADLIVDLSDLIAHSTGEKEEKEDDDAWFGAIMAPINSDYARANDLPRSALWLTHVYTDGSAAGAGFQNGDLLIRLNGEDLRLSGSGAYRYFMQTLRPRKGKKFSATVLRGKKEIQGEGVITTRDKPDTLRAEDLGITVSQIMEPMVIRMNLKQQEGVVVTDLDPGSPAATGRALGKPLLRPRDVIVAIGGIETPDLDAFSKALDTIRTEQRKEILVQFWRGPISSYEALNLRIGDTDNGEDL